MLAQLSSRFLVQRYHVFGTRRAVTYFCIICRRTSVKPKNQAMGQLPAERVFPDLVFSLDYAGSFYIELENANLPRPRHHHNTAVPMQPHCAKGAGNETKQGRGLASETNTVV